MSPFSSRFHHCCWEIWHHLQESWPVARILFSSLEVYRIFSLSQLLSTYFHSDLPQYHREGLLSPIVLGASGTHQSGNSCPLFLEKYTELTKKKIIPLLPPPPPPLFLCPLARIIIWKLLLILFFSAFHVFAFF